MTCLVFRRPTSRILSAPALVTPAAFAFISATTIENEHLDDWNDNEKDPYTKAFSQAVLVSGSSDEYQ